MKISPTVTFRVWLKRVKQIHINLIYIHTVTHTKGLIRRLNKETAAREGRFGPTAKLLAKTAVTIAGGVREVTTIQSLLNRIICLKVI